MEGLFTPLTSDEAVFSRSCADDDATDIFLNALNLL